MGDSFDKLVVRTHAPRRRAILLGLAVPAGLVLLYASFELGRYDAGFRVVDSVRGAGVLSATNRYTGTNWYDGSESGIRIENIVVNADHSVTATFTAPGVEDPCADVTCAPLEQCVRGGARAGNCDPITAPVPIVPPQPPAPPARQPPTASGCSTGSPATLLALWPLALIAGLLLRRRRG